MERIILTIPDQEFCFLESGDVDEANDKIIGKMSEPYTGTLVAVTGVVEGDDDAIVVYGVPDGETVGKLAFCKAAQDIAEAWNKVLAVKQALSEEG